ncbi:acylphosphatase [Helicobacter trogontum]|uniref:acylphosphatase n=1 Tax=Helicobacter trogontum TaxID=50960 RepID=A0A4V6I2H7_9HELI|nr:acylphosphatase [Helicobacter trogontum]MCI5787039.1 acylphosphatase [Helicobacter trogontum]MDY5184674.1 acylphosphatase [Helicobacter trogontum]TLD96122.1 acylphosphatase [Helicobacter trogontum]
MRHYKITAKGKVQGVGFRNFTKAYADSKGYTGSVQNLANGYVEIFVSLEDLGDFLEALQKGNGRMNASSFEVEHLPSLKFSSFEVLR